MTPEKARQILERWIDLKVANGITMILPIEDEVIYRINDFDVYTFIGLVKIAYCLENKPFPDIRSKLEIK